MGVAAAELPFGGPVCRALLLLRVAPTPRLLQPKFLLLCSHIGDIICLSPGWEQGTGGVKCAAPHLGADVRKFLRSGRHKALMTALVSARIDAGLTQRELARRLGRAHSFVGKIESGERQLNVLEFIEMANALGVKASELLKRVDETK